MSFNAEEFLKTVPHRPGCYRMYADAEQVIYVGKAADLRQRLGSYFTGEVSVKTAALVSHIHHIEFTVTFSEAEALLLENNLIKKFQPHYNILLRDDKSYPYLRLSGGEYPGLFYHRGARHADGEYFGPFPDAGAVHASLKLLQRLFPLRQCTDTAFRHRSRPCLLFHLGRCLAPCVPMTPQAKAQYAEQVERVRMFLRGRSRELFDRIIRLVGDDGGEAALRMQRADHFRDPGVGTGLIGTVNGVVGPKDLLNVCHSGGIHGLCDGVL